MFEPFVTHPDPSNARICAMTNHLMSARLGTEDEAADLDYYFSVWKRVSKREADLITACLNRNYFEGESSNDE